MTRTATADAAEPQALAAGVVASVLAGRNLTEALSALWVAHPDLEARRRGAVQDLAYGALRYYWRVDFLLRALITRPIAEPLLRALLLVALYQLLYSKTRPYAVVHRAVESARVLGLSWSCGFVNGVLRNFGRQREALLARAHTDEVARFNHPAWWIERLRSAWPGRWQDILAANDLHPPFTLRVNRRQADVESYRAELLQAGLSAERTGPYALTLEKAVPVERLPGFSAGRVSVQDLGAQYAAPALDLATGQRVLDACAAPGGKAAHILECADVELTALDKDPQRLARVAANLERLKLAARLVTGDATDPGPWWDGRAFDRILADVPCTASGVVRRHPDIKWLRQPGDVAQFVATQEALLAGLWRLLAPGGKLLYVTCSVFPDENGAVITRFLAEHDDARRLEPGGLPDDATDGQLLPTPVHDGFYYALLQKTY